MNTLKINSSVFGDALRCWGDAILTQIDVFLKHSANEHVGESSGNQSTYHLYEKSFVSIEGSSMIIAKFGNAKKLLVTGKGELYNEMHGEEAFGCKICDLCHTNRVIINRHLSYTNPQAFGRDTTTFGLGDRLV